MNVRTISMTLFITASLTVCGDAALIDGHNTAFTVGGGMMTVSSGGADLFDTTTGVDIIGSEREASLANLSGPGSVTAVVTGGDLVYTSDADTKGRFSVLFDGVGTSGTSLDVSSDNRIVHYFSNIVGEIQFSAVATDGNGATATRNVITLTSASTVPLDSFFASDFVFSVPPQNFDGSNIVKFEAQFEDVASSGGSGFHLGIIESAPEPFPGNFDEDGDIDGHDYLKWQRGESPDSLSVLDRTNWETNYGELATLSATSTAVPEPSTMLLAAIALLGRGRGEERGRSQYCSARYLRHARQAGSVK